VEPNGVFVWVVSNTGTEDATEIHFKFAGLDLNKTRATPLTPKSAATWPRLKSGLSDEVRVNAPDFAYLLICVDYDGKRNSEQDFYMLAGLQAGMRTSGPPHPSRSTYDELMEAFSCTNL
jgi:hypothetical protein